MESIVEKADEMNPSDFKVALVKVLLGSVAGFVAQAVTVKLVDTVVERRNNTIETSN